MTGWSQIEVEAIVTVYFDLLSDELRGLPINKRETNRSLLPLLSSRSAGSVEFKHANISAVLLELGYPYIEGYKPRGNYQELLREAVENCLAANTMLQALVKRVVEDPQIMASTFLDLTQTIVPAPVPKQPSRAAKSNHIRATQVHLGVNYLERETQNASLGKAGEEFVLTVEHARLWQAGQRQLAERIEHVSQTQGDGLGYDVLSFEETGKPRPIEVKTTRFGLMTPFFASPNEVRISKDLENYHLYRVFKYGSAAQLFILPGAIEKACRLEPTQYRASLL